MSQDMTKFLNEFKYSEIVHYPPDPQKYPLFYKARKHEFVIDEGEMVFIPAGWFHWVFSEDANPRLKLNLAFNFWYNSATDWTYGQPTVLLPRKEKCPFHFEKLPPLSTLCPLKKVQVFKSESDYFPSDRTTQRFPNLMKEEFMSIDDFYDSKNKHYYVTQCPLTDELVQEIKPKYPTDLHYAGMWMNFGNVRSLMHFDEHDNWLCQVQGRKRVVMFPIEDRPLLYMFNPIPLPFFKDIFTMETYAQAFIHHVKHLTIQPGDELNMFQDAFRDYVQKFNIQNMKHIQFTSCHRHDTSGGKIFTPKSSLHPVHMFYVEKGKGAVHFKYRTKFLLSKGELITFPSCFTYDFLIEGNLKLVFPE